jgi:hypothetical protein
MRKMECVYTFSLTVREGGRKEKGRELKRGRKKGKKDRGRKER